MVSHGHGNYTTADPLTINADNSSLPAFLHTAPFAVSALAPAGVSTFIVLAPTGAILTSSAVIRATAARLAATLTAAARLAAAACLTAAYDLTAD
jgi:hypothetical protein